MPIGCKGGRMPFPHDRATRLRSRAPRTHTLAVSSVEHAREPRRPPMNRRVVSVLVLFGVLMPISALALDNQRKGFIAGAALGLGYMRVSYDQPAVNVEAFEAAGLATGFRIGWGLNDRTEVYLFS